MCGTDAQMNVAAFLAQCAQQRNVAPTPYEDDVTRMGRLLQAEAAGRELLAALLLLPPVPRPSPGALIRGVLGSLQTVLAASLPETEVPLLLTVRTEQVLLSADAARLLCDAALLLVLAAAEDSAQNVAVELRCVSEGARLTVESERPGVATDLPSLAALRGQIAVSGGHWLVERAAHGGSWLVHVVVPATVAPATLIAEVQL